jgi:hypothetical protein
MVKNKQTKHIVLFSGGVGSWAAAKRVAAQHGTDNLILLFTDTKTEDEDLYRFIQEAANNVGGKLITLADGRNVWEVFKDARFIGNTRIDPCSRILKRELAREWIESHCQASSTIVYLGIDWTEAHRADRAGAAWLPWKVESPLIDPPLLDKQQVFGHLKDEGIKPPRLYAMGFPHNNCGGFCVKAGQAQFALLLEKLPNRYAYHEEKEQEMRQFLGKDVAILRDRRGGTTKPLTLKALRLKIEKGEKVRGGWGGCGCMLDE